MTLKNVTRGTILIKDLKKVTSFLDKTLGLLKKDSSKSLFFRTRFGIHTFFLSKPIDVIVTNKQNKIVSLKQSLQPNKIFFWNPKYNNVYELEKGVIKTSKTIVGDRLTIS